MLIYKGLLCDFEFSCGPSFEALLSVHDHEVNNQNNCLGFPPGDSSQQQALYKERSISFDEGNLPPPPPIVEPTGEQELSRRKSVVTKVAIDIEI